MRLLLLLLLSTPAAAQDSNTFGPQTLEDYARDLRSTAPGKRSFAARELRRQVRYAVRTMHKERGDPIWAAEAKVQYADLREHVAPIAARSMHKYGDVRVACADMFGLLGDDRWLPELQAGLDVATTRRQRRRIGMAIERLEKR